MMSIPKINPETLYFIGRDQEHKKVVQCVTVLKQDYIRIIIIAIDILRILFIKKCGQNLQII